MIRNNSPLSMAEVLDYVSKEDSETEVVGFIKKFNKLSSKDAKELKTELENLNILKIRPENVAKIVDFLPENSEELNKIFVDISLDEDETRKVLDAIKKFK